MTKEQTFERQTTQALFNTAKTNKTETNVEINVKIDLDVNQKVDQQINICINSNFF